MSEKQSLYTKYRPQNFDQVIGQKVAKDILINSIELNKINHAYLFYGIRGTGKTTLARIFAKAINCTNKQGHNPCNECELCKSINNSSAFDVIEIDAASNNGVDEIRTIKDNSMYLTTEAEYKVYIIDEVHMLSKQAFNALLKTLEEPPKNTIFLLATTEMQKIPQTVLSRTLIVNLEVMSDEDIKKGLKVVVEGENIEYDEESLDYLVMVASGSLRDAISALETTLLYNQTLSVDNTIQSLGLIKSEIVREYLQNDIMGLLKEIEHTDKEPKKLSFIILKEIMVLISQGNTEYIDFLNNLIRNLNTIKDPALLKVALKACILEFNVSRGTIGTKAPENSKNVSHETPTSPEGVENNAVEPKSEHVDQSEPQNNTNVDNNLDTNTNENTQKEHENVENSVENQPKEITAELLIKNVENEEYKESSIGLQVITDYVDANTYVYIMKANNSDLFKLAKDRWKFINNYIINKEYGEYAMLLAKTEPLAISNKTIIVGFKDKTQINEFKRHSLTPKLLEFIREIMSDFRFILPIDEENWAKLMIYKDKIDNDTELTDIKLDFADFVENKELIKRDKLEDLFGKENVTHEQ